MANPFVEQIRESRKAQGISSRKFKKIPAERFPVGIELEYTRQMNNLMRKWRLEIEAAIMPQLHRWVEEAKVDTRRFRADAPLDAVPVSVQQLVELFEKHIDLIRPGLITIGLNVIDHRDKDFRRIIKTATGADVFIGRPFQSTAIDSFVKENISLITKLSKETAGNIEGVILRGLRQGWSQQQIENGVMHSLQGKNGVFKNTRIRARNIVRDQMGKLNGQITQLQQSTAGITSYIWRTRLDNRVRSTHRAHEGKRYFWSRPPFDTGHPGQDFNCRCYAEPYIKSIETEVKPRRRGR